MYSIYTYVCLYIFQTTTHAVILRAMVASIRSLIPKSPANRDESDNVNDLTNWEFHYEPWKSSRPNKVPGL